MLLLIKCKLKYKKLINKLTKTIIRFCTFKNFKNKITFRLTNKFGKFG